MRPVHRLLPALLLLLLWAVPVASAQDAPVPRDIVVNEVFYNPPDEDQEFIELLNRSEKTFDLSGFAFSDANADLVPVAATAQTLPPGGTAVLARDGAALQAVFPEADFVEPGNWPALNNGGDTVTLYYTAAAAGAPLVIDAVPYEPGWGGNDNAHSLERIDPSGPSGSAANFGSSAAENGATPDAQNSLFDPDTAPPRLLFAEAVTDAVVEAAFDEPLDPASAVPAAFSVDGRAPQEAALFDEGAGVRLTFGAAVAGGILTVRGVRDLVGNTLDEATANLATAPQSGELVVNEVLYAPLADDFDDRPNQPEYVELLNTTERPLGLGGLYWTDAPTERGAADTTRLGADRTAVAPGSFALVYAAGNDADLAGAFPDVNFADSSVVLVPLDRSSLGLLNSGALLHLQRTDGTTLDSVRYDPAWHAAGLDDATGIALERLVPGGPSDEAANWTSSTAPSGGTPGRPNAAFLPPGTPPSAAGLVIEPSPFYPEGDGATSITYALDEAVSVARVRIFDAYGRRVRTLERGGLAGRTGQIPWDGLDDDGHRLRVGIYVVFLEALNAERGTTAAFKEPVVIARPMN